MKMEFYGNYEMEIVPDLKIQEDNLDKVVTRLICWIGIPAKLSGYHFVRSGIVYCLTEGMPIVNPGKVLYPVIAKEYNTNGDKVERAIRHAIETAWVRGKPDYFERVFGYSVKANTGKPTNAEFFAMVVDKLRLELRVRGDDDIR